MLIINNINQLKVNKRSREVVSCAKKKGKKGKEKKLNE